MAALIMEVPMSISVFLALLFGAYLVCCALPMIFDRKRFVDLMDNFLGNSSVLFLTGFLALIGGLSVIAFHNIWAADWRVLITIFGWIAAVEGGLLIIAPGLITSVGKALLSRPALIQIFGVAYLILGLFFLSRVII